MKEYYKAAIDFTEAILERMEALGMNRAELARRAGVSAPAVTRWLSADRNLTLVTMLKIAKAVGVKVTVSVEPLEEDTP